MSNLPIHKWKAGSISAAIWENKRDTDSGSVTFKTVSLTRAWRKKGEDIWRHDQINLRRGDIPKILVVLQKAQEQLFLESGEDEDDE